MTKYSVISVLLGSAAFGILSGIMVSQKLMSGNEAVLWAIPFGLILGIGVHIAEGGTDGN